MPGPAGVYIPPHAHQPAPGSIHLDITWDIDESFGVKAERFMSHLDARIPIATDIETTGLEWWDKEIIGLGYYAADGTYDYLVTDAEDKRNHLKWMMNERARLPECTIIAHNLKFECLFLGLSPRYRSKCQWFDTAVMVHLYDSRVRKGLEASVEYFLGIPDTKKKFKAGSRKLNVWEWPTQRVAEYCINDCFMTYQLALHLKKLLRKEEGLVQLLKKEMRYVGLLVEAERRGMAIDQNFLEAAGRIISEDAEHMEQELYNTIGREFKWRGPKNLSKAIYDDMGISKPKNPYADENGVDNSRFAWKGLYKSTCTSAFLLEKAGHPLADLILSLREADKLDRSYIRAILKLADSEPAIHGGFNPTGTRTGRLSSSKPNMQNLPGEFRTRETQVVHSGTGGFLRSQSYNLRQAFIARPNHTFLSIDYKQQEMRMFAILANEPVMLEAIRQRRDIHREVAITVWGIGDDLHREWSKTIGFGLIYGMTIGSLQHRLGVTADEAINICEQYWHAFPRIQPWLAEVAKECGQNKLIRYWSKRIWREDVKQYMYKGANAQIQGGCADILSISAMRCQDYLDENQAGQVVSFVHDELLFEVPTELLHTTAANLARIMEVEDLLGVPFATDIKTGPNYGTLEKLALATV